MLDGPLDCLLRRDASLSEIPCDSYHGIKESVGVVAFDSPAHTERTHGSHAQAGLVSHFCRANLVTCSLYVYLLACRYVWVDRLHWWGRWFCLSSISHFIPCCKTAVNYKVRGLKNKHPAVVLHCSACWQQAFFLYWDQDSNNGNVDSSPLNVC